MARPRSEGMEHDKTYSEPSDVAADKGEVVVDGPDGVAVTLTPGAAVETSHRLLEAGLEAQGQRVSERRKGKEPSAE
jgi:hypothetical protein